MSVEKIRPVVPGIYCVCTHTLIVCVCVCVVQLADRSVCIYLRGDGIKYRDILRDLSGLDYRFATSAD